MKPFILGALLLGGLSASAQNNRVSLGLNVLSQSGNETHYKSTNSFGTTLFDNKTTSFVLVPAIGYYRMIGKSTGLGLELGYGQDRAITNNVQSHSGGSSTTVRSEADYKIYHICPSIFEMFNSPNGKYRFLTSLALPITISPKTSSEYEQVQYIPGAGNITQMQTISAPERRLGIGFFVNGSIQRRIAGNLFFGPQPGVGVNHFRTKAEGNTVYIQNPGGTGERRSEVPVDNSTRSYSFQVRPTISLNYFF